MHWENYNPISSQILTLVFIYKKITLFFQSILIYLQIPTNVFLIFIQSHFLTISDTWFFLFHFVNLIYLIPFLLKFWHINNDHWFTELEQIDTLKTMLNNLEYEEMSIK